MKSLRDAALDLAAQQRVLVFPCVPRGKEPAVARGFHAATSNPQTIRRYWKVPDRNIGIATGAISGVWILDVDDEASLRAIEAQYGALPPTREVITGGGRHLWFRSTGPIPSTASRIGRGLDTRGEGGYVIGPPSIHPSGRVYAWGPYDQVAVAPEWLVALIRKKPQPSISERARQNIKAPTGAPSFYGKAALDDEIAKLAGTAPGGRNHALNRAAFALFQLVAGGELDRDQVVDRLVDACERNGLAQDDGPRSVLATIRSGAHAGMQHPRSRGAS